MEGSPSQRVVKLDGLEREAETRPLQFRTRAASTVFGKRMRKSRKRSVFHSVPRHVPELPRHGDVLRMRQAARALVRPGLGILAADETINQVDAKLKELKLINTSWNRRKLFEVFLGGMTELFTCLSGVLIRQEMVGHTLHRGRTLAHLIKDKKLKLGIRVDRGLLLLAGTCNEYTTCGLDKLEEECKKGKELGAEFALWRCVYRVSETTPSRLAIQENSNTLARFAMTCQLHGLVAILSPEVLQEGSHDERVAQGALREILTGLVKALLSSHVVMECILVRVTAAAPGSCYKDNQSIARTAAQMAATLNQCLPPAIGGVLLARERNISRSLAMLNQLQNCPIKKPFFISFCFSQVVHYDAISLWAGQEKNLDKARLELMRRLKCCSLATFGQCPGENVSLFTKIEFDCGNHQI